MWKAVPDRPAIRPAVTDWIAVSRPYFFLDKADPAAVFESLPVRPSRSTFDAELAALSLVSLDMVNLLYPIEEEPARALYVPSSILIGSHRPNILDIMLRL